MNTASIDIAGATEDADRPIRLVVVEDHAAVRKGIELIIRSANMELVGSADNAEEAYGVLVEQGPDVALIDINLPGESGADLTELILNELPDLRVLLYTGMADEKLVSQGLDRGALGVALKAGEPDELLDAIRSVAAGNRYVDPRVEVLIGGADADAHLDVDLPTPLEHAVAPGPIAAVPGHATGASGGVDDLLDRVLAFLARALGMDAAYIAEFSGAMTLRFAQGDIHSFGLESGSEMPLQDSYDLRVTTSRLPNLVPDTSDNDLTADMPFTYDANVGAYVGVPIWFTDRRHYGTLSVLSHARLPDLSPLAVDLVNLVGRYVAEELEQRELEHRVGLSSEEIDVVRRARQ